MKFIIRKMIFVVRHYNYNKQIVKKLKKDETPLLAKRISVTTL